MNHRTHFVPDQVLRTGGSSVGLPPDLLEKSRHRLKILALLVLVATGADLVQMLVAAVIEGAPDGLTATSRDLWPLYATVVTLAGALTVVALTRSQRVGNDRLLTVGLVFEVLCALIISLTNPMAIFEETGHLPAMTWVTPLIIFFPMIVPCPPRRTLVAAVAAASTRPLGLLLFAGTGALPVTGQDVAVACFSPVLAVVFATFGSRAIYSLGLDVARARRMGSYELETRLGQGGMGEVWRARHRLLARPAAVKLVRPEFLDGGGEQARAVALQRFEREAQATAGLQSPHTVELFDFGVTDDGTFYYVMELLNGVDVQDLVTRHGPVPWERAVFLLQQVCHSLAEAHGIGLVHRDIKPANVFVCRYGRDVDFVKVLDFGLVKAATEGLATDETLTQQGSVSGTPAFMAPEQAMGKSSADARADLYAVGCVAYWLLTGSLVFEAETPMEMLVQHAQAAPIPPTRRSELEIPAELERIVLACLEKDPARRPESAEALADALGGIGGADRWSRQRARRWWEQHEGSAA